MAFCRKRTHLTQNRTIRLIREMYPGLQRNAAERMYRDLQADWVIQKVPMPDSPEKLRERTEQIMQAVQRRVEESARQFGMKPDVLRFLNEGADEMDFESRVS